MREGVARDGDESVITKSILCQDGRVATKLARKVGLISLAEWGQRGDLRSGRVIVEVCLA